MLFILHLLYKLFFSIFTKQLFPFKDFLSPFNDHPSILFPSPIPHLTRGRKGEGGSGEVGRKLCKLGKTFLALYLVYMSRHFYSVPSVLYKMSLKC